jgi:hypothetical protein
VNEKPLYVIPTFTGKVVHLDDPKPEEIDIEDIAHALSQICRWGGQGPWISVAAHSVAMASYEQTTQNEFARECLLHDAAEAYLGDQISPLKRWLAEWSAEDGWKHAPYEVTHSTFNDVIGKRFNLKTPEHHGQFPNQIHTNFTTWPRVGVLDGLSLLAEISLSYGAGFHSAPLRTVTLNRMLGCYIDAMRLEADGTPRGRKAIAKRFVSIFNSLSG